MRTMLALVFVASASPSWADCPEGMHFLFGCDIIERGARVEMCSGDGKIQYRYSVDGMTELEFIGPAWGGLKNHVQGLHGHAYASAARQGDMFYAAFVDRDLMNFDAGRSGAGSPNPAVVQVYASEEAFVDPENDDPIARRVCYPPSIELDNNNFGPG